MNASKSIDELKPIWRMFGADEPNYTTLPNGRELTAELGALKPGDVFYHAKGAPNFVDGHVRMGSAEQLRTIDDGFRIVASYPALKQTPIVIGECDPEGCAACQGDQLALLVGHYHDDDVSGPVDTVDLSVSGLPAGVKAPKVSHDRIDADHSNAYEVWKKMGSPLQPTTGQLAKLEKASTLASITPPPT